MEWFDIKDHEPSLLPAGKKWTLAWADEFDGDTLDTSKWNFRLNYWGKPNPAYTDQGIRFDGKSCIELHRTERDGLYVSPQLQTGSNSFDIPINTQDNPWGENYFWKLGELPKPQFMHRFGYYECRCKFQKYSNEWWSAFWMQSPSIGTAYDPAWCGIETDIMECFKPGKFTCGNIMGGYGKQFREEGRIQDIPLKETPDGFHRFGLYWSSTEYIFYCDGEIVSRADKDVSQIPEFILLTTEVWGYRRNELPKVGEKFIDDAFVVDYVRVFDEVE